MSVFDLLGFLAPISMKGKILMQELWKVKTGWDSQIPTDLLRKWQQYLDELKSVGEFGLNRLYTEIPSSRTLCTELHIFCDASSKGFAAVTYLRFFDGAKYDITIAMAKSKVTPLKQETTIPRLELRAAHLGVRLVKFVMENHSIQIDRRYFWIDSSIVYYWIQSDPNEHKQYTEHRILVIQELSRPGEWNWLPTHLNPADEATRDSGHLSRKWLHGSEFLNLGQDGWPEELNKVRKELPDQEDKELLCTTTEVSKSSDNSSNEAPGNLADALPDETRFSSWFPLLRTVARMLLLLRSAKKENKDKPKMLTVKLIRDAELCLLKKMQQDDFSAEIELLKKKAPLSKRSLLYQLSPVLNENGVIRLKSRIAESPDVQVDTKSPIIIRARHLMARLIIRHCHETTFHQGPEYLLNILQERFWLIRSRPAIRNVCSNCVNCKIRRAKPTVPETGNLPEEQITSFQRLFTVTGIDYFGPFDIKISRRREKRYGVLFTCLTTRAIHIEMANSLTTDSATMALRRFISRRGTLREIFTDNGTNFRRTQRELSELLYEIDDRQLQDFFISKDIDWKFILPSSPHMGGCWEKLVRSVKTSLKAVTNLQVFTEEPLKTLFCEIEFIINNRPLTHVSCDPKDQAPLTPNHFLIEKRSNVFIPGSFKEKDLHLKKQWRIVQRLADNFWERWVKEYLPTLRKRSKWFNDQQSIAVNDVVVIADSNLPRNVWPKGLVTKVYPGKDKKIRVVDVKTQFGTLKRPVTKIIQILAREK